MKIGDNDGFSNELCPFFMFVDNFYIIAYNSQKEGVISLNLHSNRPKFHIIVEQPCSKQICDFPKNLKIFLFFANYKIKISKQKRGLRILCNSRI
jgi:hypothetical protein